MSPLQFRFADAQNIELLRGLRPQDGDLILKAARQRRYSARTVMTHQGERIYDIRALLQERARYFYETPEGQKANSQLDNAGPNVRRTRSAVCGTSYLSRQHGNRAG
jgi:hypothetical protein